MSEITFRVLSFSDLSFMCCWFNKPHVQQFYSLRVWTEQVIIVPDVDHMGVVYRPEALAAIVSVAK